MPLRIWTTAMCRRHAEARGFENGKVEVSAGFVTGRTDGADELILASQIYDHGARLRSYEIAAQVLDDARQSSL